jgi:hypothetical protein
MSYIQTLNKRVESRDRRVSVLYLLAISLPGTLHLAATSAHSHRRRRRRPKCTLDEVHKTTIFS